MVLTRKDFQAFSNMILITLNYSTNVTTLFFFFYFFVTFLLEQRIAKI